MVTSLIRVAPYVLFTLFGILLMGTVYLADHPKLDERPVFVFVTATPAKVTIVTPAPTIEALQTAAPSAGVEAPILAPTPVFTPTPTPAVVQPPIAQPTPAPTCVHQGQGIGKQTGLCRQQGF